jgi:hypothetical protein
LARRAGRLATALTIVVLFVGALPMRLHPKAARVKVAVIGRSSRIPLPAAEHAGCPFVVADRVDALKMAFAWVATAVTTSAATS